ncbi:M56 family metallopeptidase [Dokdonella koreensis]|uniref:Antirepressor regulating drug resistance protein n=1 Tax=Dokdonella koreensis DS-123 TaxID=1300342 RepID=A0A167G9Q5_9GAMM|nr:M56 family metallopeptidase [Dokdonella koreensis]ANB16311.1 Antirepressor regulating drug resistance protein [Dokdonella koreensis DS-123]
MLAFVESTLLPALAATVVQSLPLCALVLAACRWLPGLPATARCTLWWLVSLQLLAGLVWQAPLELPLLPAAASVPIAATASLAESPAFVAAAGPGAAVPAATGAPGLLTWLGLAWLGGVGLRLAQGARALALTRRRLRHARACYWPDAVAQLGHLSDALAIRHPPALRVSSEIRSPQLLGLWRPTVLLPAEAADWSAQDLRLALHHELAHLRRRDLAWGWIPALAECAFFFHPLARLAAREYALAREAACDAAVLAGAHEHAQAYGRLLVRLGTSPRPCAGLTGASPTFTALKRRLLMLQARTTSAPAAMTALTVALVVLGTLPYRLVAAPVVASTRSISSTTIAGSDVRTTSSTTITGSDVRIDNVLLFDEDRAQMSGSTDDLSAARALHDGKPLWWARKDGTAYVVRDAATLKRVRTAYRTLQVIGREQGTIGARQGEIGAKQGEIGIRMSEVGIAQGRLAAAREDSRSERRAALDVQQNELTQEMNELSARMEALSQEQEKLSRRMTAASARMQQDLIALLDQAIARGVAAPVN